MLDLMMNLKQEVAQTSMYQALQRAMTIAAESLAELQWAWEATTPAKLAAAGGNARPVGSTAEMAGKSIMSPGDVVQQLPVELGDMPVEDSLAPSPADAGASHGLPTKKPTDATAAAAAAEQVHIDGGLGLNAGHNRSSNGCGSSGAANSKLSSSSSSSGPWCLVQQLVVYGLGCIEDSRVSRYQVGPGGGGTVAEGWGGLDKAHAHSSAHGVVVVVYWYLHLFQWSTVFFVGSV
jgi:hypothetical protein